MLEFNVRHQRLSRVDSFRPAENSVNYLHAEIKFLTDDWTGNVRLRAKSKSDTIVHEADIVDGCVLIPWEALRNTDGFSVSVYTRDGDTEITTNYVDIYLAGTLPGGSESNPPTPTELELIRQEVVGLRQDVNNLEGEGLANAVAEYLKENPVQFEETDPTVPDWAKQPDKPDYTAAEVGAVATVNGIAPDENGNVEVTANGSGIVVSESAPDDTSVLWVDPNDDETDNLQAVIDEALAQAKASGEFKGDPGESYVLTEADKADIAEQAAQLVDVPTDDHINGLINTALGVIENGAY